MSITFFCPDAPTKLVAMDEDEPSVLSEQSTLPAIELSQDKAHAFLRLLHLPAQSEGVVAAPDVSDVSQRLLLVANNSKTRALEHLPYNDSQSQGKLRIIDFGMSDEYLQRKAHQLMDLFSQARAHNYAVVWS